MKLQEPRSTRCWNFNSFKAFSKSFNIFNVEMSCCFQSKLWFEVREDSFEVSRCHHIGSCTQNVQKNLETVTLFKLKYWHQIYKFLDQVQWMLESACTSSLLNLSQKFCKSYSQLSSLKAFKALWKWKFAPKKTAFQDVNWFTNYFMTVLSILSHVSFVPRPFTALLSVCWALSIPAIPNLLLGFTSNLYLWQY